MTLAVRVIPCLDVAAGRVVKGVNFTRLTDAGDPVAAARAYDAAGADELTFLDITATHEDRGTILDIVRKTASVCFMPLTVGGGVRTVDDVRALLLAGADKVAVNSAAVARPDLIGELARHFGEQCITVAVDAKAVSPGRWEVFTHGGRRATGIDAVAFATRRARALAEPREFIRAFRGRCRRLVDRGRAAYHRALVAAAPHGFRTVGSAGSTFRRQPARFDVAAAVRIHRSRAAFEDDALENSQCVLTRSGTWFSDVHSIP